MLLGFNWLNHVHQPLALVCFASCLATQRPELFCQWEGRIRQTQNEPEKKRTNMFVQLHTNYSVFVCMFLLTSTCTISSPSVEVTCYLSDHRCWNWAADRSWWALCVPSGRRPKVPVAMKWGKPVLPVGSGPYSFGLFWLILVVGIVESSWFGRKNMQLKKFKALHTHFIPAIFHGWDFCFGMVFEPRWQNFDEAIGEIRQKNTTSSGTMWDHVGCKVHQLPRPMLPALQAKASCMLPLFERLSHMNSVGNSGHMFGIFWLAAELLHQKKGIERDCSGGAAECCHSCWTHFWFQRRDLRCQCCCGSGADATITFI